MVKKMAVILLLSLPLFLPLVHAEDGIEGSVTVGAGAVNLDHPSFKFGEYTGIKKDGEFFIGDADVEYAKDTYYLDFRAKDLGLDNRSLYLETGRRATYKLFLGYDEIPKLISNNSKTPLNGAGSDTLTLPAGFVRGDTTSGMTNLSSSRHDVDLELQRKSGIAGFSASIGDADFKVSFKREDKEGTKSLGGTVGTSGGTTRSIVLPEPVDYTTDELRASLAYSRDTAQIQFDYYLSTFDNKKESLTWNNPFDMTGVNDPTTARISLPPDNQHQRFSLSGGINLPLATRVSAVAEYGIMEQDETLLPYSNNPTSVIATPLPRNTAETEIDITHLGLQISSSPLPKLSLSAKYRYYETDNKTPSDLFLRVKNDTGGAAQVAANSIDAAYNLPFDSVQNQLKFDASYYVFRGTTLKIGYDYDIIDRDFREIETTREKTYRARVNTNPLSFVSANVNWSEGRKRGDEYEESRVYDATHTQAYIGTIATNIQFDNNPFLRKFDIANRDRTKYGATVTLFPLDNATIGLYYNYLKDNYPDSELGLQNNKNNNYTIDATYSPADFISTYTYYTQEKLKAHQIGRQFVTSAPGKFATSIDPNRNWTADHNTDVYTAGVGINLGFMENRLTLGADYSYSESKEAIKFTAGSAITTPIAPRDPPLLRTKQQTVNTSAKYKVTKNWIVGLGYQYEKYTSDDWATDIINPASTDLLYVLTLSGSIPDYEAHVGTITIAYMW